MSYSYKDGRIWVQLKKFQPYELLLPYGMTSITDPSGALTAVREPSAAARRKTVIVDILRGEPGLPEFQIETRLRNTYNYMFGLKDLVTNFQVHMGNCDRPDNFFASEIGLAWDNVFRGDLGVDRTALIEGDDGVAAITVPFSAMTGPLLTDFNAEFLSARSVSHGEDVHGFAFLPPEYIQNCQSQEDMGENGYVGFGADVGAPAEVYYTTDKGDNWAACSDNPFGNDENVSDIEAIGLATNHRVIVSRGSPDGANPAEIAYADVTVMGTTTWVNVDVGAVNGQHINEIHMLDYMHIYAVTNDGYIYMSNNGGASWSLLDSSAGVALWNVKAINEGERAGMVVVVGASNTVMRSMDYGDSWDTETGPTDGAGDVNKALAVTPDGTIFIGNDAGEIYGSYDFATSWTTLSLQGITPTAVNDIGNFGDSQIWVVANTASGGRCLRSVDGGAAFRLWDLNIPANGGLDVLEVLDPNIVFVGGDNSVLYSDAIITKTTTNIIGI